MTEFNAVRVTHAFGQRSHTVIADNKRHSSKPLLKLFWAVITLVVFFSCSPATRQVDYRRPTTIEERNAYLAAPIVLAGLIESDEIAGPVTRSKWGKETLLQLHKMKVKVDLYLRGDLQKSNVDLYYFKIVSSYDGPPPLGHWNRWDENDKGFRRIFFLRWNNGLLRLVCDGVNTCTIPIGSGSHSQEIIGHQNSQPLDAAMAEVLFTKGRGASDRQFAGSFSTSVNYVDERYSVPKLRKFLQSPDTDIRRAACFCFRSDLNPKCMQNDQEIKAICQKKDAE